MSDSKEPQMQHEENTPQSNTGATNNAPTWHTMESPRESSNQTEHQPAINDQGNRAKKSRNGNAAQSVFTDESLHLDLDAGLAEVDPLTQKPRVSSVVLCVVFGVLFLGLAALSYWLGIRTVTGQAYEDEVISTYANAMPDVLSVPQSIVGKSAVVITVSLTLGLIGFVVALVRKRWWLVGQLAIYSAICFVAAKVLKPLLPRPFLINVDFPTANSAPSGHAMLAAAAGLVLLCAVPHAWRAVCAVISTLLTVAVGCSVIVDQWHRPADVMMAILITGGFAMIMMACTRGSGMDKPGKRVSSPSIQIVATALITIGVCCWIYAAYVIWQIEVGLQISASWTSSGACQSTTALVIGAACLVNGLVLAMRQITAAPLSRIGLLGMPPAPPSRR